MRDLISQFTDRLESCEESFAGKSFLIAAGISFHQFLNSINAVFYGLVSNRLELSSGNPRDKKLEELMLQYPVVDDEKSDR